MSPCAFDILSSLLLFGVSIYGIIYSFRKTNAKKNILSEKRVLGLLFYAFLLFIGFGVLIVAFKSMLKCIL